VEILHYDALFLSCVLKKRKAVNSNITTNKHFFKLKQMQRATRQQLIFISRCERSTSLAPVVQRLDKAFHRISSYPMDKCQENKPRHPLDSDLSSG